MRTVNSILGTKYTSGGNPSKVHFASDCAEMFVVQHGIDSSVAKISNTGNDGMVKTDLMPDFLHPNAQGTRLMLMCVQNHIRHLRLPESNL